MRDIDDDSYDKIIGIIVGILIFCFWVIVRILN